MISGEYDHGGFYAIQRSFRKCMWLVLVALISSVLPNKETTINSNSYRSVLNALSILSMSINMSSIVVSLSAGCDPDRRVYTLFTAASQTWLSKATGSLAEKWPSFKHVDGEMYNVRCRIAENGL